MENRVRMVVDSKAAGVDVLRHFPLPPPFPFPWLNLRPLPPLCPQMARRTFMENQMARRTFTENRVRMNVGIKAAGMARRTFMENRVRMIVDSKAAGVDVLQQGALPGGLSLAHSTVRMVRSCHREYMSNMGTLASLVLAITVSTGWGGGEWGPVPGAQHGAHGKQGRQQLQAPPNDVAGAGKAVRAEPGRRLWGLVVCHHCLPCMMPYPTRSACEFLVQVTPYPSPLVLVTPYPSPPPLPCQSFTLPDSPPPSCLSPSSSTLPSTPNPSTHPTLPLLTLPLLTLPLLTLPLPQLFHSQLFRSQVFHSNPFTPNLAGGVPPLLALHGALPHSFPPPCTAQVFAVQLSKEMDLANQLKAKHALKMQTLLCDMLMREPPVALVTKTPNISDLVHCDGAALFSEPPVALVTKTPNISDLVHCDGAALLYNGRCWSPAEWLLTHHSESTTCIDPLPSFPPHFMPPPGVEHSGVSADTSQRLHGIQHRLAAQRRLPPHAFTSLPSSPPRLICTEWLLTHHSDSTGFNTDSLLNAGYPHASDLGEEVCGLIAVKFSDKDFLMWFRAHAAKEVKWGGEKHDPLDVDDPTRMHPRTSFKAFLETVHMRSQPWEDVEMDAVHSLQLILRSALQTVHMRSQPWVDVEMDAVHSLQLILLSALQEHDEVKRRQLMLARVAELRLQSMDEINQVANETAPRACCSLHCVLTPGWPAPLPPPCPFFPQEHDEVKRRQLMLARVAELRLQSMDEINQVANETAPRACCSLHCVLTPGWPAPLPPPCPFFPQEHDEVKRRQLMLARVAELRLQSMDEINQVANETAPRACCSLHCVLTPGWPAPLPPPCPFFPQEHDEVKRRQLMLARVAELRLQSMDEINQVANETAPRACCSLHCVLTPGWPAPLPPPCPFFPQEHDEVKRRQLMLARVAELRLQSMDEINQVANETAPRACCSLHCVLTPGWPAPLPPPCPFFPQEHDEVKRRQLMLARVAGLRLQSMDEINQVANETEHDEVKRRQLMLARVAELRLQSMDEINQVANETVRIIETATVPILGVNRNGQINGWNMQIAKLTGVPVEEVMGRSFLQFAEVGVPVEEAMGRSFLQELVAEESKVDTQRLLVSELVAEESKADTQRLLVSSLQGREESDVEIRLKVWRSGVPAGVLIMLVNSCANRDIHNQIVGVCLVGQDITTQKIVMDRYIRCEGDYRTIVHSPNPLIPPIFGMDEYGICSEWNTGMSRLTGLGRGDVLGRLLLGEVFGLDMAMLMLRDEDAMTELEIVVNCAMEGHEDTSNHPFSFFARDGKLQWDMAMLMLRDEDAMTELEIVVNCAMEGHEDTSNHPFLFFARDGKLQEVLLTVSKRTDVDGRITTQLLPCTLPLPSCSSPTPHPAPPFRTQQEVLLTVSKRTDVDGRITGVFCFLHSMNREVQEALKAQAAAETAAQARIAQSDVARESLRAPLDGLAFIRLSLQRSASLSPDQVQLLETAAALEEQMRTILADMADLNAVEEGYLDVQRVEFSLVSVLNASLSQASGAAIAKGQQLVCSVPSPMRVRVFGDPTRLQQVLATCLRTAVEHTPPTGWIELKLEAPMRGAADVPPPQGHPSAERFRFTVAHSGDGVPGPLVQVLVGRGGVAATGLQGMALRLCRRLVHLLGGELGYAFESGRCCFRLDLQLPVKHKAEATAGSRA
ncbi:unnamed protein product [Closterium sp. Naga37s-1]|nr:unnamed protein product [Closterium sp. Naga37s-1]